MDELEWIENWYKSECNGDWEHQYGVKIETSDNPGWIITIDIKDTPLEGLEIEYKLYENSEDDWFGLSIKENIFSAAGDAKKLRFLLSKFKEIVENKK